MSSCSKHFPALCRYANWVFGYSNVIQEQRPQYFKIVMHHKRVWFLGGQEVNFRTICLMVASERKSLNHRNLEFRKKKLFINWPVLIYAKKTQEKGDKTELMEPAYTLFSKGRKYIFFLECDFQEPNMSHSSQEILSVKGITTGELWKREGGGERKREREGTYMMLSIVQVWNTLQNHVPIVSSAPSPSPSPFLLV